MNKQYDNNFLKWFPPNETWSEHPNLKLSRQNAIPVLRLICFHGAGCDARFFTNVGTARRPLPNPLIEYCVQNGVELCSIHLPGRTARLEETILTSAEEVAKQIMQVSKYTFFNISAMRESSYLPYIVIGHSMGCLIAYEWMRLVKKNSYPQPRHVVFSCSVSPDCELSDRNWNTGPDTSSEELMDECRTWNIDEDIFSPACWSIYEKIMRNDFQIIHNYKFDENKDTNNSCDKFAIPITLFSAELDYRVPEAKIVKWKKYISSDENEDVESSMKNRCISIPNGDHNFMYDKNCRAFWFEQLQIVMDKEILNIDYD